MKNDGRFKAFTQQEFLARAELIHGLKYDYSESVYLNGKTRLIIGCKKHGKFTQEARKHLTGSGCKKCLYDSLSMKRDDFLKKSLESHGDKYDYSLVSLINSKDMVDIICKDHGVFKQQASAHANGSGCAKCANNSIKLKHNDVLNRFKEIHGDRYIYDEFIYEGGLVKATIKCRTHGQFYQKPRYHLRGWGCPSCHNGSYTKTGFRELCLSKSGLGIIYLIKCFGGDEVFYKIGITSNNTKERFNNKNLMPYSFDVLRELKGNPEDIWTLEKRLNKVVSNHHYKPLIPFHGSSRECFSKINKEVLDFFQG